MFEIKIYSFSLVKITVIIQIQKLRTLKFIFLRLLNYSGINNYLLIL